MDVVDTRIEGRDLSSLRHRDLRRLADYWLSKRRGQAMPAPSGIDPAEIPWALPRLYLLDYDRGSGRFRYRLAGDEIEQQYAGLTGGSSIRGMHLDELLQPSSAPLVIDRWRPLAERGAIVHMRGLIYSSVDSTAPGERLLLPLAEDGGPVCALVGMTVHTGAPVSPSRANRRIDITYVDARALAKVALEA